jgi:release factor glutamine methyltransferase
MGLSFAVRPGVLIPRPETELLVEWALNWLRQRPNATVVDIGTGSGAIVLSLAKIAGDRWTGPAIGVDISRDGLSVATENRTRLGLDNRVGLIEGDLLGPLAQRVDLILANLPYLTPHQIADNPDLEQEPRLAVDGGEDGLELIRRMLGDAHRVLNPEGAIVLELDPAHAHEAASLAERHFASSSVHIKKDLAGLNRFVIVERNNTVESE